MNFKVTAIVLCILANFPVFGQFTYDKCGELQSSDFKLVKLFDMISPTRQGDGEAPLQEPVKFAFHMNNGKVDVYFVQLRDVAKVDKSSAKLRVYRGASEKVETLLEVEVGAKSNDGLMGLALDPNFDSNGWIYVAYSRWREWPELDDNENGTYRLSRFTIRDGGIDPSTEAYVMEVPVNRGQWHTAGPIQFDAYGDLWWSIGDNKTDYEGPANTADFRGKVIRITLKEIPEGNRATGRGITYTIPGGNLGEFMAEKYPNRANEYLDTDKVLPEIWVMGTRNAYTMTLDPVRRWMTFGDCGPDGRTPLHTEEHSLVVEPGNMGWPYFAGKNIPLEWGYDAGKNHGVHDPMAPVNDNPLNEGLELLPPAIPATHEYPKACAMTGPIYRYDPELDSKVKMPPHFDRVWFITDYNKNWIYGLTMSEDGKQVKSKVKMTDNGKLFEGMQIYRPLDFQAGPDGALYVLNYADNYKSNPNTSVVRIEYTGSCRPGPDAYPVMEHAGCTTVGDANYDPTVLPAHHDERACAGIQSTGLPRVMSGLKTDSRHIQIMEPGPHRVVARTLDGSLVVSLDGRGKTSYSLKDILSGSHAIMLFITITTPSGSYHHKFLNI